MEEEAKAQYVQAEVILAVQDEKGNKHYIFGDDFAGHALGDVLSSANEMEVYYAEKEGKIN